MLDKIKEFVLNNKLVLGLIAGAMILAKFSSILISLLIGSAKKDMELAKKQDQALKSEQDALNQEANSLADKARESQPAAPAKEDWNKNEK